MSSQMRVPQPEGERGSKRWIQHFVNRDPEALSTAIDRPGVKWCSPLEIDEFAEYSDEDALNLFKLRPAVRLLKPFWPPRGPRWDAVGQAGTGEIVLVEAKAHIAEIITPASKASEESSRLIGQSLIETAEALGARDGHVDWSRTFYQYTNRLAHAYFLSQINKIPTLLVFLCFVGDRDMDGPADKREWVAALAVLHEAIGLRGTMPKYVKDVFLEVPPIGKPTQIGDHS
jgi:hypothetical protein